MRRVLVTLFVLGVGVGQSGSVCGGEAGDILFRAYKAQCGNLDIGNSDVVVKIKGTLFVDGAGVPIEGQFTNERGRGWQQEQFLLKVHFKETTLVFLNGALVVGDIGDVTPNQYIQAKRSLDQIRAALLGALLSPSVEEATAVGESKIGERVALGLRLTLTDRTVRGGFFDKETGCLLKMIFPEREVRPRSPPFEMVFDGHSENTFWAADTKVLKAAGIDADAAAVTAFVKKQAPQPETLDKVRAFIIKLGDDNFEEREQATKDVIAIGSPALPLLEKAMKSTDPEVARRAVEAVNSIKVRQGNATVKSAVRLFARLKPANATEVLLNHLNDADEEVGSEILAVLAALAQREGKIDPILEKALLDKDAKKRAAAEAVLGKDGGAYLKRPGQRLYPETSRFPAKAKILVADKTVAEIEFVDVQFFNRLDERVVEKPRE